MKFPFVSTKSNGNYIRSIIQEGGLFAIQAPKLFIGREIYHRWEEKAALINSECLVQVAALGNGA